jgi:hypothetical protein
LIDEKHRLGEIVFLTESMEERSRRVRPVVAEQVDVKKEFCVDIYCSVWTRPLTVYFDSALVDRDRRRARRRRIENTIGNSMNPLKNRLKRAIYADITGNPFVSLSEHPVAWSRMANAPTGIVVPSRCQHPS